MALPSLRAVVAAGHEVVGVLTRPDAPAGRGRRLTASPVAELATELGLRVHKPRTPDADLVAWARGTGADAAVVVAFGMLLTQELLDAVPGGWINLHFSLLPRWRGAAPVQRAILAGDQRTGATTFRIVKALDAGPVYRSVTVPIGPGQTSGELLDQLAGLGAPLLVGSLADVAAGIEPVPQGTDGITLASKINPADVRVDWHAPAAQIELLVRAANPDPSAWTELGGQRFQVLGVRRGGPGGPDDLRPGQLVADRKHLWVGTGDHPLELVRVQAFGRKPMSGADWVRGQQGGLDPSARFDG